MPTQTDQQRQNSFQAAGLPYTPTPISVAGLNTNEAPAIVPQHMEPTLPTGAIDASINSLVNATSPEQTQSNDIQSRILSSLDKLGTKGARQNELQTAAGLPAQNQQLQDVVNQLQGLQKESLAIPLQIQQEAQGRGVTEGGVAPIQAARLRENAIKSLGLAAIGQTLQGNITLANQTIQNALDAEFAPEQGKLDTLNKLYEFNKDALTRADSKRSEQLGILLNERTRLLEVDKANKNEIYNIGKIAGQYGADSATIQKIFASKTREEALAAAGTSLVDPKAQYELEGARLDNVLKKAQIAKEQKETSLLGEQTAADKKAEQEALKSAETAIPLLQDKIGSIDALKTSRGLTGSVGPYAIARWTPFSIDKGDRINFIAGVEQLTSKETLDALVNLKAQGGTLGALSDGEREMLQGAATKIGNWALKDKNGKVYGYEVSEGDFKAELDRIKELSQRALNKARGSVFADDEKSVLDEAFPAMNGSTPSGLVSGIKFYQ